MIESDYDLELDRVVKEIIKLPCKRSKNSAQSPAKTVCLQFPDGMKPLATEVADEIEKRTGARIMIWMGTCFGACDTPLGLENLKVDLLVQWGHSPWS